MLVKNASWFTGLNHVGAAINVSHFGIQEISNLGHDRFQKIQELFRGEFQIQHCKWVSGSLRYLFVIEKEIEYFLSIIIQIYIW